MYRNYIKNMETLNVGFIGGGQMMNAIAGGSIAVGLLKAENIYVSDVSKECLENAKKHLGVNTTHDNLTVLSHSDFIVFAIKPQILPIVLDEIRDHVKAKHLLVSIAAGTKLKTLEDALPQNTRIVRVMPNTPALVQMGASYIAKGTHATDDDVQLVAKVFQSIGITEIGAERLMDAITGMSGSGPAYVYTAIEAMADGGVRMGLPRSVAQKFAAQTFMGAAKMVLETGKHPGELKDNVCSPGGTTIAGMHALEKNGYRGTIMSAVEAATLRSIDLSKH